SSVSFLMAVALAPRGLCHGASKYDGDGHRCCWILICEALRGGENLELRGRLLLSVILAPFF
ncbi:MAG: hypothetical protein QMB33_04360, partial [Opitutales bacterium]